MLTCSPPSSTRLSPRPSLRRSRPTRPPSPSRRSSPLSSPRLRVVCLVSLIFVCFLLFALLHVSLTSLLFSRVSRLSGLGFSSLTIWHRPLSTPLSSNSHILSPYIRLSPYLTLPPPYILTYTRRNLAIAIPLLLNLFSLEIFKVDGCVTSQLRLSVPLTFQLMETPSP